MKKIMFNDKYGLTQAVLDGRKTMTRRIITCPRTFRGEWVTGFNVHIRQSDRNVVGLPCMYDEDEREFDGGEILPTYKVGEEVAVSMCYKDIVERIAKKGYDVAEWMDEHHITTDLSGWLNKMFVKAGLMIFKIRITNVKIERLQDISDDECINEGVQLSEEQYQYDGTKVYFVQDLADKGSRWNRMFCKRFDTPREAYAALIDKVSGKGTWERNPWVFAYTFELID